MSFSGKVSVVTGAAGGIGRELARQLAASGSDVAVSDVNAEGLAETAAIIESKTGRRVTTYRVDVSDREAVAGFADQVISDHGRVDILINNAGIALANRNAADTPITDFERVLGINLLGVIYCTQSFLPHLLKSSGAHIVNLSSIFGFVAIPEGAPYATSKFGVRGYTEALRADLAPRGICVSSVHPGVVASNLVKAAGSDDEIVERFEKTGMPPATAARKILKGVARRKTRIRVVWQAYVIDWVQRLLPTHYPKVLYPLFGVSAKN